MRAATVLLAAVVLLGGCTRRNQDFCCTTAEACERHGGDGTLRPCEDPDRPFCDNEGEYEASGGVGRTCIPLPGQPCSGDTCDDPDSPVCFEGICVECGGPEDCGPDRPVCGELDHVCAGCQEAADCERFADRPFCEAGACIGCRDPDDCADPAAPYCDLEERVCRGCEAHEECDSGVCDLGGGACVAADRVLYVRTTGTDAADCTAIAPCKTVQYAVGRIDGDRRWILVAPGTYEENVVLQEVTARLVGPGAVIETKGAGLPVLRAVDTDVAIDGLTLRYAGGGGDPGLADGVYCVSGGTGAVARLALRQVTVADNAGHGVESHGCELRIERSTLRGNLRGGLLADGARFEVTNSFLVRNGDDAAVVGGARLEGSATSRFEHNTVADNQIADGLAAGLDCAGGAVLRNNIIYGNIAGTALDDDDEQVDGNCGHEYSLIGPRPEPGDGNVTPAPPRFADPDGGDYHLTDGSPAIDSAAASDVLVDHDGEPRPAGDGPDIGADEAPTP